MKIKWQWNIENGKKGDLGWMTNVLLSPPQFAVPKTLQYGNKAFMAHSKATKSSGNPLTAFAGFRFIDGFRWGWGQDCCQISELHPVPCCRAGGRPPHQKPPYKILLGMAGLSLWMPRSMDYPPDNKAMSFCLRCSRHFPKVPVWLRAVTFQSTIFLICSRTLVVPLKFLSSKHVIIQLGNLIN